MIPKIIHYCWFGRGEKPELVEQCLASWHKYMQDWEYMEWTEDSVAKYCQENNLKSPIFDLRYCTEAYAARKYAFVSDYVRLWALERIGGLYMDVDFEVYKSFEPLLYCPEGAFVGREGSKHQPPMLGVMAAEAHSPWIQTMQRAYEARRFKIEDCRFEIEGCRLKDSEQYDMTTNVSYFAARGVHKPEWVKIYPVEYFCPILTTGEDVRLRSEEYRLHNYCEHKGLHSWGKSGGWKAKVLGMVSPKMKTKLIEWKRWLIG